MIGSTVEAELEAYRGATGGVTTLSDTMFSTIPGSPAYVAKAQKFTMSIQALNLHVDLQNHNAIQGHFVFEH